MIVFLGGPWLGGEASTFDILGFPKVVVRLYLFCRIDFIERAELLLLGVGGFANTFFFEFPLSGLLRI